MKNKKNEIWFPAKKHGVGWGLPVTWQGWVVFMFYFCFSFIPVKILMSYPKGMLIYIPYFIGLTLLFIIIVWKKGEPENCTPKQVEECHGKTGEHACTCDSEKEKKTK